MYSRKRKEGNMAGEQQTHFRIQPYLVVQGNNTGRPGLPSNRGKQANGGAIQVSTRFHDLILT